MWPQLKRFIGDACPIENKKKSQASKWKSIEMQTGESFHITFQQQQQQQQQQHETRAAFVPFNNGVKEHVTSQISAPFSLS